MFHNNTNYTLKHITYSCMLLIQYMFHVQIIRNAIFANIMQIAVQLDSLRSELCKINLHQII
jgi:hypothetical protein